eukprot:CAMPEP_0171483036 /NCGR_PEP_ID=MMETSP0946-20130122/7888_1 /TAXON_ID=109269 /ORGANISM="Vaucheria litorea, Strain CCMP2940" /LENGTH=93 /DNA_ID=CAMNT_0012015295 /DNA_START=783 /DNA_END=1060 /DNA_ORIENTATION=-
MEAYYIQAILSTISHLFQKGRKIVLEMTKENFVDALSEILNGNSEQVIQFDVLNLVMEMAKIEKSDEGKVIHVPEGVQAISGLLLSDWDEVQT